MRRTVVFDRLAAIGVACCLLASFAPAAPAAAQRVLPAEALAADDYIVVLHSDANRNDLIDDYRDVVDARRRYNGVFNGFAGRMTPGAAGLLAADPRVEAVEADGSMHRVYAQGRPAWGLDRIDQPGRRLDDTYAYSSRGSHVTTYVVDGGVFARHREFGDRVEGGFDTTGLGARNDCDGHGTHVAATLGGRRFGVAKLVRIVPVRIVDCSPYIRRSDVIAGLDYIVRHHRRGTPAVVNISLGGPVSPVADRAVNRVIDDGITVVTAAGNGDSSACTTSPARVPRVITVSAVNQNDRAPDWANNGSCVDLYAPGVDIRSAGISSRTATRSASGTSMAAPHVAGAAARYLSAHRTATPTRVVRHLLQTATHRARDVGANTTTRTLYVRGRVPTGLANALSRESVDPDDDVVLRTRLRNRVTGAGLMRSVELWSRPDETTTWQKLATRETGYQGIASFTHTPRQRTAYQWRHAGTGRTLQSRSAVREVGFRRWDTSLTWLTGAGVIGKIAADGQGLAHLRVDLDSRLPDGTWQQVDTTITEYGGRADFSEYNLVAGTYRLRHEGTAKSQAAVSGAQRN